MNQFATDSAVDDSEFVFGYINEVGKPTASQREDLIRILMLEGLETKVYIWQA
jgi:hypothetical protein